MSILPEIKEFTDDSKNRDFFLLLQEELHQGLLLYWNSANEILDGTGVKLKIPSQEYFSLENNFFSGLFWYSYFRAGLPQSKRVLFAALNQCLRGMVTGCDNILDNEYKITLDTNLPISAEKFRSILDIMMSDRIMMVIMHKGYHDGDFCFDHILKANTASLHSLLQSGVQEASEEKGVGKMIPPDDILNKIHPVKTGILFQAPWVLPQLIEDQDLKAVETLKKGLFQIGMGCQILDDMVDLCMDIQMNRHNYVASYIRHGTNSIERHLLIEHLAQKDSVPNDPQLLLDFPAAKAAAVKKAVSFLEEGTTMLFGKPHQFMVPYSIDFFINRIGARHFF